MIGSLHHLLTELRTGLVAIYGIRLRGVYLFGSYARNEADAESDVDVLVVLDRVGQYGEEVSVTGSLTSQLSLQFGVSISRVFVSQQDWTDHHTPFLANVRIESLGSDLELCMTETDRYYGVLDQITPSDYSAPMVRACVTAFFLMCLAAPVWATEAESFDPDQPFNQALTTSALRSLLSQALDRLEDHVEISGNLHSDDTKGDRGDICGSNSFRRASQSPISISQPKGGSAHLPNPANMIGVFNSGSRTIAPRNISPHRSNRRCRVACCSMVTFAYHCVKFSSF